MLIVRSLRIEELSMMTTKSWSSTLSRFGVCFTNRDFAMVTELEIQ